MAAAAMIVPVVGGTGIRDDGGRAISGPDDRGDGTDRGTLLNFPVSTTPAPMASGVATAGAGDRSGAGLAPSLGGADPGAAGSAGSGASGGSTGQGSTSGGAGSTDDQPGSTDPTAQPEPTTEPEPSDEPVPVPLPTLPGRTTGLPLPSATVTLPGL